jgi:hypothetical protein
MREQIPSTRKIILRRDFLSEMEEDFTGFNPIVPGPFRTLATYCITENDTADQPLNAREYSTSVFSGYSLGLLYFWPHS